MNTLKIEYVDIDSITPYKNNTKKHPQEQIDQIKASVEKFKVCKPIGVADGTILTGHGLHESLKQLNHKKVAIIDLSHLSESERKAYIIADNKLTLNSGFDDELLKIELESLYKDGLDLNLTGFDDFEIEELDVDFDLFDDGVERGGVGACDVDESKADEVPSIEDVPIIKRGDLIELGHNFQHRVLCGDSTSEKDVSKLMGGGIG